jgi:hypothetical protein
MTVDNDDIIITVEDGGFLTFDEKNGKALCRQILYVNVMPSMNYSKSWDVVIYPTHFEKFSMRFSTKELANGLLDLIYEACLDLDKMSSGVKTDTIVKTRVYKYG